MEQRKQPLFTFIKPILHSLQLTHDEHTHEEMNFTPVMPLIDVVEAIHHSYYFKKPIVVHFEQYTADGQLQHFTKTGISQSKIQANHHFIFEADGLSHLLTLEQIVSVVPVD